MNTFKVGDWVKNTFLNNIYQVKDIFKDGYSWYATPIKLHPRNLWDSGVYGTPDLCKDLELWQPQIGEWCWFRGMLVKIIDINEYGYINAVDGSTELHTFSIDELSFCEPFIGTLPSFVKEIK